VAIHTLSLRNCQRGAKTEVFDPWLGGKNFCCGYRPSGPGKIRLSHQQIETHLTWAWIRDYA
jgi:hypothetical protein